MGRAILAVLVIAFVALAPFILPEFQVTLMSYIGLSSLVVLGLVLLTGVGGMTSFGHAAFVGIAAYTTAYLTINFGISPWLTLFAGLAITGCAAFAIGAITLRLDGHYLPLSTIAWGISIFFLFGNIASLGGYTGLAGIPPIEVFGFALDTNQKVYPLIWGAVFLTILAITNLLDSRPGRAIRALKGGVLMAESFGINTPRTKIAVFVYSALLASLSGWLYAHLLRFVNPTPFNVIMGIEYLFMAVIGGASYVWGAILGSALLTLMKHWLQDYIPKILGEAGNYELIVFGVLIALILQRARDGLMKPIYALLPPSERQLVVRDAPLLPERTKPPAGENLLVVEGLTKRFGGLTAVNNLSFRVAAGEIVGLIGPNGAGKSTSFALISGLEPQTAGSVSFRGKSIDGARPRDIIRLGIARSFQHVHLLPAMTVLENVMIGAHVRAQTGLVSASLRLDRTSEEQLRFEAARQLRRVGLGENLHELAGNLSLGQQRITEIARALCADPALLLLDEPAAGLRYMEKKLLGELLSSLRAEGMGILLVEHDMEFVMNLVDNLIVMDFGEKIAEGKPLTIQSDSRVIESYLGGIDDDEAA